MQQRPHIAKILAEGKDAFNKFVNNNGDQQAFGKYQGFRRALQFIQFYDSDVNNKEDAAIAFRDLSTYGEPVPSELEVPDRRESFTNA